MVGFGLGFGSRSMSRQYAALGQNVPISTLSPSAAWNGTAGSGFAGSPPVDPVRTTAKPACRLLVPPNQYFTDELVIGVWAGANDQGSMLEDLGLERVLVHYEGTSFAIEAPSFYLFEDANGNAVRYFGWWAVLQHSGTNGHANVYFEAVPKDATMQSRVIGPYQFSPQAVLHDYQIEVAATPAEITGVRYKTIAAALNYLTAMSAQNPLVTFTESFTGDFGTINYYPGGAGYTTIAASAPVLFSKPGLLPGTGSLFRPRVDGLWFRGPNIAFDFKDAAYIYHELPANRAHVFDGIQFADSGGRYRLANLGQKGTTYVARDTPWFLECTMDSIQNAGNGAALVRGCLLDNGNADAVTAATCVIGNVIRNWTSEDWRTEIPALTVRYTGTGTSATLELSGGNETNNRIFTAKVQGSTVDTFTVRNAEADFTANTNYTVANVVAWLNSLPGWTATMLDNTRRATALSIAANGGSAFAATDVKTATRTLVTMFDQHADLWSWADLPENVLFVDNLCYNNSVQSIFVAPPAGMRDAMILNNVFDLDPADLDFGAFLNQLAAPQSHVVIAHNSATNQELILRRDTTYNPDSYCLLANNISSRIRWLGTGIDSDLVIRDNHLHGGESIPAGATGTTLGGNRQTLFLNPAAGDFTPHGALLGVLKTPVLRHDRDGVARGLPALLGALAGPGDVAPAITSGNPSGTYPENQAIGGILVANKPVTWSVEGPDASLVVVDGVSGVWSLAQTDFEAKSSFAFTFVATDSNMDTASQVVAINLTDLDEIAPVLSAPAAAANGTSGANLSIATDEGNGTLYWFVSTSASPPTAANLIAGIGAAAGGSQAIAAAGPYSASVSGLAASTTYFAFFLHRDAQGNNSTIAQAGSFTTNAASSGAASVVSFATLSNTSATNSLYNASGPFAYVGGANRALIVVATLCQNVTNVITDLTATVNGVQMTRVAGASRTGGATRPICAVFVATGLAGGDKTIAVSLAGSGRSCTVLAMEVADVNTASILASAFAIEGQTLSYSHSHTPTVSGNLIVSALSTRGGDRGPFTPDAGVIEMQDLSTGATATTDHTVFVGHTVAQGTSAINVGATTSVGADALFVVAEFNKA